MARVKAVLRRKQTMRGDSPLTGLPGNYQITSALERRIKTGDPFDLVQSDLDKFKSLNDHYGFMRGDQMITFSARTMLEEREEITYEATLVGHIGREDFVAVMHPDVVESYCKAVLRIFDDGVLHSYDTADALRGYIEVSDRRGERHAFPMVSISLWDFEHHSADRFAVGGVCQSCRNERVRKTSDRLVV